LVMIGLSTIALGNLKTSILAYMVQFSLVVLSVMHSCRKHLHIGHGVASTETAGFGKEPPADNRVFHVYCPRLCTTHGQFTPLPGIVYHV
jgi:hypothetical protein